MRPKYFHRSQGYEPIELLRYAVDHKNAALLLFEESFDYHDSAAYLAHLSVELCLKALLLERTDRFPESHNLAVLSDDLRSVGLDLQWKAPEQQALHLLGADWDVRYPHPTHQSPSVILTGTRFFFCGRDFQTRFPQNSGNRSKRCRATRKAGEF